MKSDGVTLASGHENGEVNFWDIREANFYRNFPPIPKRLASFYTLPTAKI